LSSGLVVDAAGRGSSVRRHLGGRAVAHDRLVALTGVVAPDPEMADRRALIEATEHGWWYSAVLPDASLVLAFHTDAAPGLRGRWPALLAAAPHTAARVGGRPVTGARHVAANSLRREPGAGVGWLAVGDAAAAHDPIAGLGVYWAMESGLAAADAILAGDAAALAAYGDATKTRFADYLVRRTTYYRAEGRWPDSPFWHARRGG
jgi:flavin-dependent dehydrogenase